LTRDCAGGRYNQIGVISEFEYLVKYANLSTEHVTMYEK